MKSSKYIFILPWLFSFYLCDVSVEKKTKLLADLINYYNSLPTKDFTICDGNIRSLREIDVSSYFIEVSLNTSTENKNPVKCSAKIKDSGEAGITVIDNYFNCKEEETPGSKEASSDELGDVQELRTPIKLENEVQADTGVTSGEQFIAIPKHQTAVPCMGCSSHVNPQAAGVNDFANMGVRHLDLHEPTVKHSLESVLEVERQVQIVSGVKYILTLLINFNNCTETETDSCIFTKPCKVSILVKPWKTLPSGAKYRAILANNCTEDWLFGDNGEILPEDNQHGNESSEHDIKADRYKDVDASPNHEKTLTAAELKAIEDQIIGQDTDKFEKVETTDQQTVPVTETTQQDTVPVTETVEQQTGYLSEDKKQAIDGILGLLDLQTTVKSKRRRRSLLRRKRRHNNHLQATFLTTLDSVEKEPHNVDNPKYKKLAEESLIKYMETSSSQQNYKIVRIERVTVEKNAGKSTNIDFVISPTDCVIEGKGTSSSNCNLVNSEITINCHSTIVQQDSHNNKKYTVNCITNDQIPHRSRQLLSLKQKNSNDIMVSQDVNDLKYTKIAEEALRKYVQESGSAQSLLLTMIKNVLTTESSEGLVTRVDFIASGEKKNDLFKCSVKLWERPWMKKKDVKVSCQIDGQKHSKVIDYMKDLNQIGNITKQNPQDRKYLKLAEESLQKYLVENGNRKPHKVLSVDKVSILGSLARIDFVVQSVEKNNSYEFSCHSKIWEKPWLNKKEINVTCPTDSQRWKRQLVGGIKEENPNEPKYFTLAEESLQQYLRETNNRRPHKVLRVEKVFSQVVAGSLTRIEFVVTSVDNVSADVFRCHSKIWEQAWVYKKEIDVSCRTVYKRWKRKLSGKITKQKPNDTKHSSEDSKKLKSHSVHNIVEHDPNDLKYFSLAEESLEKYITNSSNRLNLRVLNVEKVSSLKTALTGTLTMIDFTVTSGDSVRDAYTMSCHSQIWKQSWIDKHEIRVSCPAGNNALSGQILYSDVTEQNPNEPKYLTLAEESLKKHFNELGLQYHHHGIRVQTASTQEVAGLLTRIDFVATSSDATDHKEFSCHSEIWEQSWINEKAILVSCSNSNSRLKRQIPGGFQEQNPNESKYLALSEESLQKYLSNIGNTRPHSIVRVDKVLTQVVAGSLAIIDFVAKPADSVGGDEFSCHSEIWEQSWAKEKEIKVFCSINKIRLKKQIPGGIQEQNPNDPKYVALAEKALQKYLSTIGNTQPHIIVRVDTVSTQVVAGSLTRIDFVAKPADNVDTDDFSCHSEIWEQPWLNKTNIEVSCSINKSRLKKQLPGGIQEQNPNDPKYVALAEESLQKYLSTIGNTRPHIIVRVDTVSTQVVSGSLTRIDFLAEPADNAGGDEFNCHSEIWEQPWVNKKNIEVSCLGSKNRLKRGMPGGIQAQNPNDPKYVVLAEESLQKYLNTIGNTRPHIIVRVNTVSTQVVSGSLTRIDFLAKPADNTDGDAFNCHSEIWEQPWVNKKNIEVSCSGSKNRLKRGMPGGIQAQNPNDPKYVALAEESLQKYLSTIGNRRRHIIVRVDTVSTQVVSGSLTRIDFLAKPADNAGGDVFKCHSEIWEQPWVNKKNIEVSCSGSQNRLKRQMPGGITEQNPNESKYLALAEESLLKYLSTIGITRPHKIVRVDKVSTQVVAGSMTRIDFVAKPSDNVSADEFSCHSEIWEQSWPKEKEIKVSCSINKSRYKEQIPGGIQEQNPNDPKYLALAEESLQKYLSTIGNTRPHMIVRVVTVSTQVVAGSLTRIDFVAKPADNGDADEFSCLSKVWEQPWVNKTNIEVSCSDSKNRLKRGTPGGTEVQNPNDPKYVALAEESLQKYLSTIGNTRRHIIVRVNTVSTQVVSGLVTRINFLAKPADNAGGDEFSCHSEIWEQKWLNKKNIEVSCTMNKKRVRRETAGVIMKQNPNDPEYLELAEESLHKYLNDNGIKHLYLVVRIDKVSTQVNAGTLTRIDFVIMSAGNVGADEYYCHSKIWERTGLKRKEINVTCKIDYPDKDPNSPTYVQLAEESLQTYLTEKNIRREYNVAQIVKVDTNDQTIKLDFLITPVNNPNGDVHNCLSKIFMKSSSNKKKFDVFCAISSNKHKRDLEYGIKHKDPTDPRYLKLAQNSLKEFLQNSNNKIPYKVIRVNKVTIENLSDIWTRIHFIVAPADNVTKLYQCFSTIWEHYWITSTQNNVTCLLDDVVENRAVPDGLTEENPTDGKFIYLAESSLDVYLSSASDTESHKVLRLYRVLGNDTYTILNFEALQTGESNVVMNCSSEIIRNKIQKNKIKCTKNVIKTSQKRELLFGNNMIQRSQTKKGGEIEEDVTNPEYKLLAAQALRKFSKRTGILYKLLKVARVTKRVVAGLMYVIKFSASPTACSSDVSQALALSCKETNNVTVSCTANVWDQPWIRKVKINVQCNTSEADASQNSSSDKESGSKNDSNEKKKLNPNIYALAEEALEKYLMLTRRKYFYKITKIVSSSTSVTDGISTNIMFLISPTVCQRHVYMESIDACALKKPLVEYNCKAKIIEHPWIEANKDIRITCQKLYTNDERKRQKRQMFDFDNGSEEEDTDKNVILYYLQRAVKEVNKQTDKNDTFKLEVVHAAQVNMQKDAPVAKMMIQIANNKVHRLCNVKIYPSPGDKYMIKHISVICDDIDVNGSVGGLNILKLIKLSMKEIQSDPNLNFKIVHRGEPKINYKIKSNDPIKLFFSYATTNCPTKYSAKNTTNCAIDITVPLKYCVSFMWRDTRTKAINYINVTCDVDPNKLMESFDIDNNENNVEEIPKKVNKQFNNQKLMNSLTEENNQFNNQKLKNSLTEKALRLIEAKYPQTKKLKIEQVTMFKQIIEGTHYRIKVTVGCTNCTALSDQNICQFVEDKFILCHIDVWLDKESVQPPLFQVNCALETGYAADHAQARALFNIFLDKYKPKYINNKEERKNRFEIFKENVRKIHNFNVFERATATYGVTRFADLTYEEFSSMYTGLVKSMRENDDKYRFMKQADVPNIKIPETFDWREFDAVTDVKDQGHCRGSWAFSVAGNIEGQIRIKMKNQLSLSEQQLMDCDKLNHACEGGLPENAYRALMETDANKCLFKNLKPNVRISGGVNISSGELKMAKWLVQNGPISIGVNAAPMQFYLGGIIRPKAKLCKSTKQDHNVLIVGYGEEVHQIYNKKIPYWIVKNSWGKSWGEQGFYRLYRGNNTCGVSKMATSVLLES